MASPFLSAMALLSRRRRLMKPSFALTHARSWQKKKNETVCSINVGGGNSGGRLDRRSDPVAFYQVFAGVEKRGRKSQCRKEAVLTSPDPMKQRTLPYRLSLVRTRINARLKGEKTRQLYRYSRKLTLIMWLRFDLFSPKSKNRLQFSLKKRNEQVGGGLWNPLAFCKLEKGEKEFSGRESPWRLSISSPQQQEKICEISVAREMWQYTLNLYLWLIRRPCSKGG